MHISRNSALLCRTMLCLQMFGTCVMHLACMPPHHPHAAHKHVPACPAWHSLHPGTFLSARLGTQALAGDGGDMITHWHADWRHALALRHCFLWWCHQHTLTRGLEACTAWHGQGCSTPGHSESSLAAFSSCPGGRFSTLDLLLHGTWTTPALGGDISGHQGLMHRAWSQPPAAGCWWVSSRGHHGYQGTKPSHVEGPVEVALRCVSAAHSTSPGWVGRPCLCLLVTAMPALRAFWASWHLSLEPCCWHVYGSWHLMQAQRLQALRCSWLGHRH